MPASRTPADVAVVVVTHNSRPVVGGLLDSLGTGFDQAHLAHLVVVDNDSTDGTEELVRSHPLKPTVISMGRNAGYAAAINAGMAARRAFAYLVLNPDVRLGTGAADALVAATAAPGVGIAVPKIRNADGSLARSLRRRPTVARAWGEALLGGSRASHFPRLGEVVGEARAYESQHAADWATGAAWLVTHECVATVGEWDESFFLYSEETDYALRSRAAGFDLTFVPNAVVEHIGGDAHSSPRLWALLVLNRVYCFRKHNGPARGLLFWLANVVGCGLRSVGGRATQRRALGALLGADGRAALMGRPPVSRGR